MEKVLIVGAGGLGRMTMEVLENFYDCYFIDDNIKAGTIICGCEVIGTISDLKQLNEKFKKIVIAIGNNKLREKISTLCEVIGYDFPIVVNHTAYVSKYAVLKNGCIILSNASIQNGAKIGKGVVITANVEIHHDCEIDDYALIYSNSTVRTNAHIGKRAKIGSNVSISNDVKINEDEEIQNGETI